MIITVTERGSFRRCKRLWDYTSFNRQSLTGIMTRPVFALGTLVHATLEDYTEAPDCDVEASFIKHSREMMDLVETKYREAVGANISAVERGPYLDVMNLGYTMINNYITRWGAPLPPGYTLIQSEQQCLVDLKGVPDNWLCGGCGHRWWVNPEYEEDVRLNCPNCEQTFPHGVATITREKAQLEGKLDGFVMDKDKRMYVLERKTYGQRPKLEHLQMNDQFLAYQWILTQLFPGYTVGGILYDGLYKKDVGGRKPHVRTLEDLFIRHTFMRTPHELEEFEENVAAEYRDMMNADIMYPNRNWMGCIDCGMNRLCTAQSRGDDDYEHIKRTYYTLRERDKDDEPDDIDEG